MRRNSTTIALIIVMVSVGTILYIQSVATANLQREIDGQQQLIKQVKNLAVSLDAHAQERTNQIDQLNKHLDCIVTFFSQTDRSQTSIDDINTCTLKNGQTGSTNITNPAGVSSAPHSSTSVTVTPQASATPGVPTSSAPASSAPPEDSSQPSFFQRTIVSPIKAIINGL